MPIEIEQTETQKLAGHANKAIEYFEKSPSHYQTVLAIGAVALVILFIFCAKSIFWMTLALGILYLVGVKTLRKKERPKPVMQQDW